MVPDGRSPRAEAAEHEIENQSAVVTAAEPMDSDRREEVEDALETYREMIPEEVPADRPPNSLDEAIDMAEDEAGEEEAVLETVAERIEKLEDRADRPFPSLLRLRFRPENGLEFVSGQYTRISYAEEEPRVYSIASSPNAEEVELCVRRVPGGHLTPTLCEECEAGDELFVRGPYGDEFVLQDPSARDMVFVATGTGAAPFKSMIDYVFEEGFDEFDGEQRNVWLFLGSSWKDDLPYREAFESLASEHENFFFVPTLSREEYLSDWEGETAYVQNTLVKYFDPEAVGEDLPPDIAGFVGEEIATDVDARIDPADTEFYVCGLGVMCGSVEDVVSAFDVEDRQYQQESYG